MRISDWSSDVCSSDLTSPFPFAGISGGGELVCEDQSNGCVPLDIFGPNISDEGLNFITTRSTSSEEAEMQVATGYISGNLMELPAGPVGFAAGFEWRDVSAFFIPSRSEEHTSELQSLMRISYDVFCLKKKK